MGSINLAISSKWAFTSQVGSGGGVALLITARTHCTESNSSGDLEIKILYYQSSGNYRFSSKDTLDRLFPHT